jgi:hypothetical protein
MLIQVRGRVGDYVFESINKLEVMADVGLQWRIRSVKRRRGIATYTLASPSAMIIDKNTTRPCHIQLRFGLAAPHAQGHGLVRKMLVHQGSRICSQRTRIV